MEHVAFTLKNKEGHVFRVIRKGAHLLTETNQRIPLRVNDYIVYLGKRFSNRPFEQFRRKPRFKFTPKRIPAWQEETLDGLFENRAAAVPSRISDEVFMFVPWEQLGDWWAEEGSSPPPTRAAKQGYFQPAGMEEKFLKLEGLYENLDVTKLVGVPKFLSEVPGSGRSHFDEEDLPLYRIAMKTAQEELETTWFGDETPSTVEDSDGNQPHPLSELLACLRAMHWNYWTSHWQSRGDAYYGDHLLFQRLYEGMVGEIDQLAEKIVGSYGEELVNPSDQADLNLQFQEMFGEVEDLFERGIAIEEDLQGRLSEIYDLLKENGTMTLGLDDYIMSLASEHETNIYLLQQRRKEL